MPQGTGGQGVKKKQKSENAREITDDGTERLRRRPKREEKGKKKKEKTEEHRPSLVWTRRCRAAELGPDTLGRLLAGPAIGGSSVPSSRLGADLTGDAPYLELCAIPGEWECREATMMNHVSMRLTTYISRHVHDKDSSNLCKYAGLIAYRADIPYLPISTK